MLDFWVTLINRISPHFPSVPSFKHQGEIQRLAETTRVIQKSPGLMGISLMFAALHRLLLPRFGLCAVPNRPHHPQHPRCPCPHTGSGTEHSTCKQSCSYGIRWGDRKQVLFFCELFHCSHVQELSRMTGDFIKPCSLIQQQTTN